MTELQRFRRYTATIKTRVSDAYVPRPEALQFDGRTALFACDGPIESRPEYDGESYMTPIETWGWPYGWIASGDLTDIRPAA